MNDTKGTRFSEKEKNILYSLFKKYQSIIDIRHRRYSQHKQAELRKCWDTILETFNANSETSERTIKQLQKFWLNAKLRNRLPPHSNSPASSAQNNSAKILNTDHDLKDIEFKLIKMKANGTASDSDNASIGNKSYEEKYTNQLQIGEAFQVEYENDHLQGQLILNSGAMPIGTKIINNTQNLSTMVSSSTASSLASPNTYIINSIEHIQPNRLNSDGTLLATHGNEPLLESITESVPEQVSVTGSPMYLPRDQRLVSPEMSQMQKQESELRLRELQLKCEIEEIRKEMVREELRQMREIHKMKVREMELRLKNMDRT